MGTGSIYGVEVRETVGQQIERLNKRIVELEMEVKELKAYKRQEEQDLKLLQGSITDKSLKGQLTIGCVLTHF